MQEKNSKNKKNTILAVLLAVVLVVAVAGVSYAIFNWSGAGQKSNVITTGSIECSFNEGTPISLTAAHPITDNVGKTLTAGSVDGYTQGYYDATLSCTCVGTCSGDYEIYANNTSDTSNVLSQEYVKTYVTDGAETETELNGVTTFESLETAASDASAKKIYSGTFDKTFTQKIRLRLWVSDRYTVTSTSNVFKAKLNAKVNG